MIINATSGRFSLSHKNNRAFWPGLIFLNCLQILKIIIDIFGRSQGLSEAPVIGDTEHLHETVVYKMLSKRTEFRQSV